MVDVGDRAPEFKLLGVPDGEYSLSRFPGKIVVLAFYPADNSPVCTTQLRTYTMDQASFDSLDAVVLGISPQGIASHKAFYEEQAIKLPLLADEDKTVAQAYGVLGPLGFYRRSVFVINRDGLITYAHRTTAGLSFSPTSVLIEAISQAG
ncbi:MAG: peroxiredoxin [Acidimicrobiaceae bacterium]|nr:peroxiredoxin [Acidimicrobiaceae bacterium]